MSAVVPTDLDPTRAKLWLQLSEEERQSVLAKMREFTQQPVGHLPHQDELYLEQQLSEWFGFEVTAELDGVRLSHSVGVMTAHPHLKRHPSDQLEEHQSYQEAGMANRRSRFGWFTELGQLTPASAALEEYYFAVQAEFLPDWAKRETELLQWFKYRKMVMINPQESRAVVGVIGNLGPSDWLQAQFAASPEVIRAGRVWSPTTQGKVFLLFVNDPEEKVAVGVLPLTAPH